MKLVTSVEWLCMSKRNESIECFVWFGWNDGLKQMHVKANQGDFQHTKWV